MTTTQHLGITLIDQSQSQKEITVNKALTRMDAVLNTGAKSRVTNTPPGSPATGDLYIVGTTPTGAWAGQAKMLTYFDQIWNFIPPNTGMTLWVNDESVTYTYNGTSWVASAGGTGTVNSVSVVSANGVSGSVATPTTTPAITLTLGALTPASIAASGSISGSNLNSNTAFTGPASSLKTFTLPNASDSIACLGQVNAFTKQQYFAQTTLTDAASISWDASANQAAIVTLAGNRTLANPSNLQAGASYTIIVKQDATGSRTLAYGTSYKWSGGTAPVLSTSANAIDILTFITDGTNMYGVAQKGFA